MMKELRINMKANDVLNQNGEIMVKMWFEGDTYNCKDDIKAIGGYKWAGYEKKWVKNVKASELQNEIAKAAEIGAEPVMTEQEFMESRSYKLAEMIAEDCRTKKMNA